MNGARPKCHSINKSTGFWCGLPLRLKLVADTGQYMYHCPVHALRVGVEKNPDRVKPEAVMV